MKAYILGFLMLITTEFFAQQKKPITCDEIKKYIDYKIQDTLPNGNLIARLDRAKNKKLYKIIFDGNGFNYVTKSVTKKIKKYIRKHNCKGISIQKLDSINSSEINIIRD